MSVENVNQVNQTQQVSGVDGDKAQINQELKRIDAHMDSDKQYQKKADDDKFFMKQLSNATKTKEPQKPADAGTRILASLVKDLGLNLAPRTSGKSNTGKIDEEIDKMLEKTGKQKADATKDQLTKEAVKRTQGREEQERQDREKEEITRRFDAQDTRAAAQDYSSAFASYALSSSPEAKEKLEDAQDRLKRKGFSEKEIVGLEKAVKRTFRHSFLSDIQNNFIQTMMSPSHTFESVVTERRLNTSYDEAVKAGTLSGVSGDREAVKDTMGQVRDASLVELKDFIRDAVESNLMSKHLTDVDNKNELKQLVQFGNKIGFNFEQFVKDWEQKKVDLGLVIFEMQGQISPEMQGQIAIGDVSSSGVGERHGFEMTDQEEKELFINQLRAEFMKKALDTGAFAAFRLTPKISKLKNGLIKLGLVAEDFTKIEKEAKALARFRTLEMLRDAFIERSTYYELSGTAYSLLNNKMKGLISNLEHLGLKLEKDQLDALRDEANRQMHDHTIIELKSALALIGNHPDPKLEERVPLMVRLIERLRGESHFTHGLGEDIGDIIDRYKSGDKTFKENA